MLIPEMFCDLTAGDGQADPARFIVAGAFARGLSKIGDPPDHSKYGFSQ